MHRPCPWDGRGCLANWAQTKLSKDEHCYGLSIDVLVTNCARRLGLSGFLMHVRVIAGPPGLLSTRRHVAQKGHCGLHVCVADW